MGKQPHTAGAESLTDRIERWLLKAQQRDYQRDRGEGFRSAREVGQAVGLSRDAARRALASLADEGRILRFDFSNGLTWRSANLLPYETGRPWCATPPAAIAKASGADS
jgi:predicted ArsR family transcriptional regulator